MARFIFIYSGPAAQMSEEMGAAWGAWMQKVGSALVDEGAPFGKGSVVVDNGSHKEPTNHNGYSIVEAADLASAVALTEGNPLLSGDQGIYNIEVFELLSM